MVEVTAKGAVPVATVEVNDPVTDKDVPVAAPIFGVTRVGLVANTNEPVPVLSVIAAKRFAEDGVASHVAMPVPKPLIPVLIGMPVKFVPVNVGVLLQATAAADPALTGTCPAVPYPVVPLNAGVVPKLVENPNAPEALIT